jgi:hypothetical protein
MLCMCQLVSYVCRIDFLKMSFKSVYSSYPDRSFLTSLSLQTDIGMLPQIMPQSLQNFSSVSRNIIEFDTSPELLTALLSKP